MHDVELTIYNLHNIQMYVHVYHSFAVKKKSLGGFGRMKQFTIAEDDEENEDAIVLEEGTSNQCTSYLCCYYHSYWLNTIRHFDYCLKF